MGTHWGHSMGPGHWCVATCNVQRCWLEGCDDAVIIPVARPLEASVGHLRYHPGIMSLEAGPGEDNQS